MTAQQEHAIGRARHMLPGMERRLAAALAGLAKLDRKCMEARKMRPRHIRRGKRVLAAMLVLARDQRDSYHVDTLRWLMGRPLNWRTSGKFDVQDLPKGLSTHLCGCVGSLLLFHGEDCVRCRAVRTTESARAAWDWGRVRPLRAQIQEFKDLLGGAA